MKMVITNRGQIPYGGGWITRDRLSGQEITGTTLEMVIARVIEHRKANSLPIGLDIEHEIEGWLCEDHPTECQAETLVTIRKRHLGLGDVIMGTKVMLSLIKNGGHLVPREEAERRAQICIKCPYNAEYSRPCTGVCAALKEVVDWIVNKQGTQYDSQLKACMVCGCHNQSAVWVPLALQTTPLSEHQREQFEALGNNCWKRASQIQEQI